MDEYPKQNKGMKKPGRKPGKPKGGRAGNGPATAPIVTNPPDARLEEILNTYKNVAIVGLTPEQETPSNRVARFLRRHGFILYPVNPRYASILGEICCPYVRDVDKPVDVVCVFRRPEHLAGIIEDALHVGARVIWLQLGIINEEFSQQAKNAGLDVVMDLCMKREYERLILKRSVPSRHGT